MEPCKKHGIKNCPVCRFPPLKRSDIEAQKLGFKIIKFACDLIRHFYKK